MVESSSDLEERVQSEKTNLTVVFANGENMDEKDLSTLQEVQTVKTAKSNFFYF